MRTFVRMEENRINVEVSMIIDNLRKIKNEINIEKAAKDKYSSDKAKYVKLCDEFGGMPITEEFPQLFDYCQTAGSVDGHYFMQDIHVAELISKSGIKKHYDIGSKIDFFIAHLLANSHIDEVVMLDIRPFPYDIKKLSFIQADATELSNLADNSISSISSLHAIEHFGLGRYGDEVDPLACYKAMKAMQRVTEVGGLIYISVPVSNEDKCCFNAHRVFAPHSIVEQFDNCELLEMSFVLDKHQLKTYAGNDAMNMIHDRSYSLGDYDCGIFVFKKIEA